MNANGGDYDYWVKYSASQRWIQREDGCSFDWDILDYGGTDESYRVPGKELLKLLNLAIETIRKEILFRKF